MIALFLLLACGGGEAPKTAEGGDAAADPGKADPGEAGDDRAAHGQGGGDHAGHHAGGSGHMAEMAATRDKLRADLGDAYDQPVAGLDTANPDNGKALYATHCASCHGDAGKGDGPAGKGLNPPAADFTDAFHARFYSDAGRVRIIEKGSPNTAMAGFEGTLDRQQILDVYAYVRSLRPAAGGQP